MNQAELQSSGDLPLKWFFAVAVLVVTAYGNSLFAEFQFDDYAVLAQLEWARSRPIPYATLFINHALGGENVVGYHIVNLVVHLLVCFAVYRLIGELCRTPRMRGTWTAHHALPIAVAATLVVGCHPLQVQAVTYIAQRMTSIAALFYLATIFNYVRARTRLADGEARSGIFWEAIVCAIAAYLSKESTASLPLALLLVECVFFRPIAWVPLARRLLPFVLLVLIIPVVFRVASIRPLPPAAEDAADQNAAEVVQLLAQQTRDVGRTLILAAELPEGLTPWTYLLTQFRVVPQYFALAILPVGLTVDHDVPIEGTLTIGSAAGMMLLLALALLGFYAAAHWPLVGFGILWIFVALSVESSILPIRDVMNEHRMYLPMLGIGLLAGIAFAGIWSRQRTVATTLGVATAVALLGLTLVRNRVWSTQLSLWGEALERSPNKARVHVNYGTALHLKGDVKEAVKHYCEALRLEPENRQAESNINVALEHLMESDEVDMEIAATGPEGEMELVPRHPCPSKPRR